MVKQKKLIALLLMVCFAFTFLPVAAFAAAVDVTTVDYQESSVFTEAENVEKKTEKDVSVQFDFVDKSGKALDSVTGSVFVWFVKEGADVAATSVEVGSNNDATMSATGVFKIVNPKTGTDYNFKFNNSGVYVVKAAFANPDEVDGTLAEKFADVEYKLDSVSNHKEIEITVSQSSANYQIQLVSADGLTFSWNKTGMQSVPVKDVVLADGGMVYIGAGVNVATEYVSQHLIPNGVPTDDITFKLVDENGKAVKGEKVYLSTNSTHCVVSDDVVTTDSLGQFDFTIALDQDSPNDDFFSVYIECGSFMAELKVVASSATPSTIGITSITSAPIATDDVTAGSDLGDYLMINVKDANGNWVMPYAMQQGGQHPEPAFAGVYRNGLYGTVTNLNDYADGAEHYVSIVSQPAASDLDNEDVWMIPTKTAPFQSTLYFKEELVAGDYTFKVTLANGNSVNVSITVAEFGKPVKIQATPKAPVVELGGTTKVDYKLVDENGTTMKALKKGVEVAVNGYGVYDSYDDNAGTVYVSTKTDEEYLGEEIKLIATSDRYNLVAETVLHITTGNARIISPLTEAKVGVPTDMVYMLMDENGTVLTDANCASNGKISIIGGHVSFTVLDKPEGANVNFEARSAGGAATAMPGDVYGQARIESDKPGVVTAKMTFAYTLETASKEIINRSYEGTVKVNFVDGTGTGSGGVVVMSIGSNSIVVDNAISSIDAAPMIQNARTFVPFRALAEAFGAEVSYDAATQAVTAELNGTTVVMTIGDGGYTVNGAEKSADVAPFISNSRTMVPVRFVAEAFGITVTPTYDDNGATADILFAL